MGYGDGWESEKQRQARLRRRKIIDDWKVEAEALRNADPAKQKLLREAKRESLRRREDAARTIEDFENIKILWDNLEIVERYRIGKQEVRYSDELPDTELSNLHVIIPIPFDHVWWRQLLRGSFLDVIHDCPHDVPELTSSHPVYDFACELDDMHRELMYYWAIRRWTPQRIAAYLGKTDRNIRKVYNVMIEDFRVKLYVRLEKRYKAKLPLTVTQKEFCRTFWDQVDEKDKVRIAKKIARERCRQKEKRKVPYKIRRHDDE